MRARARWPWIAALGAAALLSVPAARGEVRAITDHNGEYRMTRVLAHPRVVDRSRGAGQALGVWQPVGRGAGARTLNPSGDRLGDLWPAIAEPQGDGAAWVLWSRDNRGDYDLAWSRWTGRRWTAIDWLYRGIRGDDLDPSITVDRMGQPYAVWWVDRGGVGVVFFSMYLETRWMVPLVVSDPAVDSRTPSIAIEDPEIVIRYAAEGGTREYIVRLTRPASITDDINPLGLLNGKLVPQLTDRRP
jgi:hypothetical protein